MRQHSGIGVLDKAMTVLHAVAEQPCNLNELCTRTGLPRATAHRLAVGSRSAPPPHARRRRAVAPGPGSGRTRRQRRRLPRRGRLPRPAPACAKSPARACSCTGAKAPTGCASPRWNRPTGLRDTVLVGARLPMTAGSGAKVLLAWADTAVPARDPARRRVRRTCPHRGPPSRMGAERGRTRTGRRERRRAGPGRRRRCRRRDLGVRADRPDGTPAGRPLGRRPSRGRRRLAQAPLNPDALWSADVRGIVTVLRRHGNATSRADNHDDRLPKSPSSSTTAGWRPWRRSARTGMPHLVAMWYAVLDGEIWFETKAKSQKVVNLRRDNRRHRPGRGRRHVRPPARRRDRGPRRDHRRPDSAVRRRASTSGSATPAPTPRRRGPPSSR